VLAGKQRGHLTLNSIVPWKSQLGILLRVKLSCFSAGTWQPELIMATSDSACDSIKCFRSVPKAALHVFQMNTLQTPDHISHHYNTMGHERFILEVKVGIIMRIRAILIT